MNAPRRPQKNRIGDDRKLYAKDCLDVLTDEDALPDNSVDLIYLDPPFNSKSKYNLPFKGQYKKDARPVMAFKDTWTWNETETELLAKLQEGDEDDRMLADIISISKRVSKERPNAKISKSAYLLNMAVRLRAMRRVLKPTGSIYLHCDPTASYYLKMIMDVVFQQKNFKNEIVWCYTGPSNTKRYYPRKHDVILFYGGEESRFNADSVRVPYDAETIAERMDEHGEGEAEDLFSEGKIPEDWWRIPALTNQRERLGYPTQKPLALLDRIIRASSNEGDVVLDPFCGCGTTVHAAEILNRRWVGIDISQFSAGQIRNRIIDNFEDLKREDIPIFGCPLTVAQAAELAERDKFEFEKWACGEVGAQGLFQAPGERGADGGVDGIIPFYYNERLFDQKPPEKTFAVVQVKGGKVHPDAVRALSATVREAGGKCGVMICFEKYMGTVERNREKKLIRSMEEDFNFIQGLSVEDLIDGKQPNLPRARYAA